MAPALLVDVNFEAGRQPLRSGAAAGSGVASLPKSAVSFIPVDSPSGFRPGRFRNGLQTQFSQADQFAISGP